MRILQSRKCKYLTFTLVCNNNRRTEKTQRVPTFSHTYRAPYVIFTTHFGVHRVHLNVSSSVETLVEGGRGYGAVDYHYR